MSGGGHGARTGLIVVGPRRVQIFDSGLSKALAVSGNGLFIPMIGEAGSLRSEAAREGGGNCTIAIGRRCLIARLRLVGAA